MHLNARVVRLGDCRSPSDQESTHDYPVDCAIDFILSSNCTEPSERMERQKATVLGGNWLGGIEMLCMSGVSC